MKIRHVRRFLIIIVAVIWAAVAVWSFMSNLSDIQNKTTNDRLYTVAESNASDVDFIFKRYVKTLVTVAKSVELVENFRSPETLKLLNDIYREDSFLRLAIDSVNGESYTSDGFVFNIAKFNYADKIRAGRPFVIDVLDIVGDGTNTVNVLVPLKNKDGQYTSALRGALSTKKLTGVFENTFVTVGGYYHVVDGAGNYVSEGESSSALLMDDKNYFEALNKLSFEKGFSADRIKHDFAAKRNGYSRYSFDGQERYTYYSPIGVNDWMVVMVIPKAIVELEKAEHVANAFGLITQISSILLIFALYIYLSQKRERNVALMNEKSFRVLAEHTNKVVFEWDFEENKVTALSSFQTLFGEYDGESREFSVDSVHPDDRAAFTDVLARVKKGENIKGVKLRLADGSGVYHWCALSIIVIEDDSGKAHKAIGTLENIDEQIKQEESLRKKAELDQLTGLNNKTTTEYFIKELLEDSKSCSQKHALLIIDVDNFKDVNDKLGHLYGDMVLAQLADLLKATFRADDVVGRIGGDEFFVLLKNYTSPDLPQKKAKEIADKFHKRYTTDNASINVSVSIGIASYPEHGREFDDLYKAADAALYAAKAEGKNRYMMFNNHTISINKSVRTEIEISGGLQKSFKENRLEYIFKILYGTEKTKEAVISVLQVLAEQFRFSRVNIFEVNEDTQEFTCTSEWCAEGVSPIRDLYHSISLGRYEHIVKAFERHGDMFAMASKDLDASLQEHYVAINAKFLCYFAVMDQGRLVGSITFQDCLHDSLQLSSEEFNELRTICQILSTFMLKQKMNEREKNHHLIVENMMNSMDDYVYVIDRDSMQVLYENNRTREVTKKNSLGEKCHVAYMNSQERCAVCPLQYLVDGVTRYTVEIDNEKYGVCSRTTGSVIDWLNNKKAHMINSVDITEYKKDK